MKILEEFNGFVDGIRGGIAFVTLKNNAGEILEGEYPSDKLAEKGIRERRRFKLRTVQTGTDEVEVEFESIPDKKISEQRLKEIEEMIAKI